MYNDYPTIYESNINFNYIYMGIAAAILLAIIIITFISLAKIFKKANRSGISAWIPIYNIFILLEITNKPKWYLLLMFIPIINLIIYVNIYFSLARTFRKSTLFTIGMLILPFIFLPILAFSDNEYFGINLIAMEQKETITNIPIIDDAKSNSPQIEEHLEKDQNLKNINISIGGGVYQKNYTNDLLQIDERQAILKETEEQLKKIEEEQKNITITNSSNMFISQNQISEQKIQSQQHENKNFNHLEIPTIIPDNNNNINNNTAIKDNNISSTTFISSENSVTKTNDGFILCPKCGVQLKADTKKCFLCGNILEQNL